MSETAFELEILTPESLVYQGRVASMILPAADGLMGVLPNHAPIVAATDIGEVTVREEAGGRRLFMVTDGFFEMADNKARILTESGEAAEKIDLARARRAVARARERLANGAEGADEGGLVDFGRAERALQRAIRRVLIATRLMDEKDTR